MLYFLKPKLNYPRNRQREALSEPPAPP